MSEAPINPDLPILDDPEAGSTWFISLVSIVLLVVTVLALVVMYFGFEAAEVDRKVVDKPTMALEELRGELFPDTSDDLRRWLPSAVLVF